MDPPLPPVLQVPSAWERMATVPDGTLAVDEERPMTATATPELEALYCQLAQRHPELLVGCPCIEYIRDREDSWIRCLPCSDCEDVHLDHTKSLCRNQCQGTGVVVPPFDTWLGRLVRVVSCVDFPYINCPTNDGDITQQCAAVITGTDFYGVGTTPEEALLRAMLAAEGAA